MNSEKVSRVNTYIERYETGDTSASVRAVSHALRAFSEREDYQMLAEEMKKTKGVSSSGNAAAWKFLVYGDRKGPDLSNDLDNIVGFYSSLQTCVAASICDRRVAHAFFDQPATTLRENFKGYIVDRQRTAQDFAKGLEHFCAEAQPTHDPS